MTKLTADERSVVVFFKKYNEGRRALSRETINLLPDFAGRMGALNAVLDGMQAKGLLSPIYAGSTSVEPGGYNLTAAGRSSF